jgi:hypothetical protein
MERLQNFFAWVSEESLFWGEVLSEVLGLYQNKYTREISRREQERDQSERHIQKQSLYEKLSI